MAHQPANSPFLPLPPLVPNPSTFAIKTDFTNLGITEAEILNVPLHDGQPYRLTVSNLPITGPAGPGVVEVTVFERIGFETLARASFCVAHGQAETITGIGPVIVRARSRAINTLVQADFFLTINPQVAKEIPPLSGIETVAAAYNTIVLNAGFPAAYRSKLTILSNGQIDVAGIDAAGAIVFEAVNYTAYRLLDNCPMQWDPALRVQLRGSGGAAAATSASVIWTRSGRE
jgi:hypothetical protein